MNTSLGVHRISSSKNKEMEIRINGEREREREGTNPEFSAAVGVERNIYPVDLKLAIVVLIPPLPRQLYIPVYVSRQWPV